VHSMVSVAFLFTLGRLFLIKVPPPSILLSAIVHAVRTSTSSIPYPATFLSTCQSFFQLLPLLPILPYSNLFPVSSDLLRTELPDRVHKLFPPCPQFLPDPRPTQKNYVFFPPHTQSSFFGFVANFVFFPSAWPVLAAVPAVSLLMHVIGFVSVSFLFFHRDLLCFSPPFPPPSFFSVPAAIPHV